MKIGRTNAVQQLTPAEATDGPLVSIIMPTFHRPEHISPSIRSLLIGEFHDFELLVRDDGDGRDGTEQAVLAAAVGDTRVRYHRNRTNLGIANNLNSGIRESRGEFIAVCHDHDLYGPGFLKAMVDALIRYPSALYVHCASRTAGRRDQPASSNGGNFRELTPGAEWLKFMLETPHCPVCALTLVRRSAHELYGLYNPGYGFVSDVEMWMRLSLHGDVAFVAEPHLWLRQRESDHPAHFHFATITRTLARIHSDYVPRAYAGSERIKAQVRIYCWAVKMLMRGTGQRLKVALFQHSGPRSAAVDLTSSNRRPRGLS